MATLIEKLGQMFGRRSRSELEISVSADPDDLPVKKMTRAQQREATLIQLKRGYEEVVDTMSTLRTHMEDQSRRSDRMLNLMEGLPDVLRSIPESNARQTQVLQAMREQMETQAQTTTQLSVALTELAGATGQQQQAMAGLQSQMEANRASGEALRDSLGILSETMDTMTQASRSNVDAVNAIAEQSRDNQEQTASLYRHAQRHSTVMAAVSWALALAALAVSGYVAVMVSKEFSKDPAPAQPAPVADAPDDAGGAGAMGGGSGSSATGNTASVGVPSMMPPEDLGAIEAELEATILKMAPSAEPEAPVDIEAPTEAVDPPLELVEPPEDQAIDQAVEVIEEEMVEEAAEPAEAVDATEPVEADATAGAAAAPAEAAE